MIGGQLIETTCWLRCKYRLLLKTASFVVHVGYIHVDCFSIVITGANTV